MKRHNEVTMPFNLCPDDGPPRLWRFVDDNIMTTAKMVSMLDHKQNILLINRPLYDKLPWIDQHRLLRTHERIEYAS